MPEDMVKKLRKPNTVNYSMLRKPRSELLLNIHEIILRKAY